MGTPGPRHLWTGGHSKTGFHFRNSCDPEGNEAAGGTDGCAVDFGVGGGDSAGCFAYFTTGWRALHVPEAIWQHTYVSRGVARYWAPNDHLDHSHITTDSAYSWSFDLPLLDDGLLSRVSLLTEPERIALTDAEWDYTWDLALDAAKDEGGDPDDAYRALCDFCGFGKPWGPDEVASPAYRAAFAALAGWDQDGRPGVEEW